MGLKGEPRDVFSLRNRGAKFAVHLGVGLPRSIGSDGLGCVQLLQALRVRLLASPLQTLSQYSSGGSRLSRFCKGVIALAQGGQTARPEMASGLSGSSALLSLMRAASYHVSIGLWESLQLKGETRDVFSSRFRGAKLAVHLGVGLPRSVRSDCLGRVQLLPALHVRLLASRFQTFRQDSSG